MLLPFVIQLATEYIKERLKLSIFTMPQAESSWKESPTIQFPRKGIMPDCLSTATAARTAGQEN